MQLWNQHVFGLWKVGIIWERDSKIVIQQFQEHYAMSQNYRVPFPSLLFWSFCEDVHFPSLFSPFLWFLILVLNSARPHTDSLISHSQPGKRTCVNKSWNSQHLQQVRWRRWTTLSFSCSCFRAAALSLLAETLVVFRDWFSLCSLSTTFFISPMVFSRSGTVLPPGPLCWGAQEVSFFFSSFC